MNEYKNDFYKERVYKQNGNTHIGKTFDEEGCPRLCLESRKLYALSYVHEGFVSDKAVTEEGLLTADIDKVTGANVKYYLVENDGIFTATSRKMALDNNNKLDDLPTYDAIKDIIDETEENRLISLANEGNLYEISSLARNPSSSPENILQLLRYQYQESVGNEEVWLGGIVLNTLHMLEKYLRPENIRVISEEIPPPSDDNGYIQTNLKLVPFTIGVDSFMGNLQQSAEDKSGDGKSRAFAKASFLFFSFNFPEEKLNQIPEDVIDYRQYLKKQGYK